MAAFEDFKAPEDLELWKLGEKENWELLEKILEPLTSHDNAAVKSIESKMKLAAIRKDFDSSLTGNNCGIISLIVEDGDNAELLKKLLSLGMHPDMEVEEDQWRPLHLCSYHGRVDCAKTILLCRPNLGVLNQDGNNPLQIASPGNLDVRYDAVYKDKPSEIEDILKKRRPAIHSFLLEAEKNGFPKLAEMAMNKQWWAVKNLVRHQVVTEGEAIEKFNGRDALEWAVHHGETEIAEELKYYFSGALAMEAVKTCEKRIETEAAATKTEIDSLRKHVSELAEEKDRIQAQLGPNFKKQMSELSEAMSATIVKVQGIAEEVGTVDKVMGDNEKLVQNESSKIWKAMKGVQERMKNVEQKLKVLEESHSASSTSSKEGAAVGWESEFGSAEGGPSKKRNLAGMSNIHQVRPGSDLGRRIEDSSSSSSHQILVAHDASRRDELSGAEHQPHSASANVSLHACGLDPAKMYGDLLKFMDPKEAWNTILGILDQASKNLRQ